VFCTGGASSIELKNSQSLSRLQGCREQERSGLWFCLQTEEERIAEVIPDTFPGTLI